MTPEVERKVGVLRKKAWTLIDVKKLQEGFVHLDEAIALAPEEGTLRVDKGLAFQKSGLMVEALAEFEAASGIDPGLPLAWLEQGRCLEVLLQRKEAVVRYRRGLDANPGDPKLLAQLGNALAEMRDFGEALKVFERLLEIRPREAEAWLCKGLIVWKSGDAAKGLEAIDRALQQNPKLVEAYIHRARVLKQLGRDAEARKSCAEAIQKGPQFVEGYILAAELVLEADRPEDALSYADKAIAIDPSDADAWRLKARAHEKLGRALASRVCAGLATLHGGAPEKALEIMDGVVAEDPKFHHGHAQRATVLERLGRFADALAAYDQALALEPKDPKIHFSRGLVLFVGLERKDDAIAAFQKAVSLNPKLWNEVPPELRKRVNKPTYWS